MSLFCVLLCNIICAHHILPTGSVEEVSAAVSSSGVSCGILLSARRLSDNVLTSVLACLFQMFTVSHSAILCLSVLCLFLSLPSMSPSFPWLLSLPLSLAASAFVSEWERPVPRPPLMVPHRVGHVETLPRPPHPPWIRRLRWHHITLLRTGSAKLQYRYTTLTVYFCTRLHILCSDCKCPERPSAGPVLRPKKRPNHSY